MSIYPHFSHRYGESVVVMIINADIGQGRWIIVRVVEELSHCPRLCIIMVCGSQKQNQMLCMGSACCRALLELNCIKTNLNESGSLLMEEGPMTLLCDN